MIASLARRIVLILVTCACFADGASAAQSVKLHVAFDPNVPGQRTTIELGLRVIGSGGSPPSPVRELLLRLPASMGIATTTLGQANCEPDALMSFGLSGCSGNARIGFGRASAVVPVGSRNVREDASVSALMGPPEEDRLEVLFYVQALKPVFGALVLPSVVEEVAAPFGEELATSVPLVQAWPEGPRLSLESFYSTIGPLHLTYHRQVNGRNVAYHPHGVRVPRSCPVGGYPFQALLTFVDGTRASNVYRVPCNQHWARS